MSSCCSAPGLMPLEQAIEQMLNAVDGINHQETCVLGSSLGRVLAEDIQSQINVPGYDNSAMDGYALRAGDLADLESNDQLTLIGKSFAGEPFTGEVEAGQCVRIMTGAKMPVGADSVIMQEQTEVVDDATIKFQKNCKQGNNIRRAGEDIPQGEVVFQKGHQISPADIGLLASIGIYHIPVYRPLKVAIFSTGDELRIPGQPLGDGCIYDSNRFVIEAMLKRLHVEIHNLGIIPDQPDRLRETFTSASKNCDVIISSGGVSVGEADYTKDILDELGRINFWKVAIKPGKPFAFGYIENAVFFGLPGNPVSATVTFHQLAMPAMQKMMGIEDAEAATSLQASTQFNLKKQPGRTDFQRGTVSTNADGELIVADSGNQGSGVLSSIAKSNAYIKLPKDQGKVEAGEQVEVILFDSILK